MVTVKPRKPRKPESENIRFAIKSNEGSATFMVECYKNRFDRKLSVVTDLPILVSDWVIHFYDDDKPGFDVPIINDLGSSNEAIILGLPVSLDTLFRKTNS